MLKSRLLLASALVLGSASFAAAQYDSDNMMNYQRTGPQLQSAGSNYDGRFDEDNMTNYGPVGYSALAQAPAPQVATVPRGGNPNNPFDQELMESYGPGGAPR